MVRLPLLVYTRTVSIVGAMIVLAAVPGLGRTPVVLEWLLFSVLVIAAGRFTSRIPSVEASISVSDTFFIAAALLFGAGPAMMTVAADGLLLSLRRRYNWNRTWFNSLPRPCHSGRPLRCSSSSVDFRRLRARMSLSAACCCPS